MMRAIEFGLLSILLNTAFTAAQPASKPTLESRWADLASRDDGKATRALLALSADPKAALGLLQGHLKPVKADAKRVEQLLKQLGSNKFVQRTEALDELEYLGTSIKNDLEAALKKNFGVETEMRVRILLAKLTDKKSDPSPPTLRAVRAVALLEHLATPEAKHLLQAMAAGEPDALPTVAARAALERVKK